MSEKHKKFLRDNTLENSEYLLFIDLVYFKEKSSKYLEDALLENRIKVFELFKMQIEYYRPKLVLVANAFTSNLLLSCIQNCEYDEVEPKIYERISGKPIVFSSMLSNGNMDRFSILRLRSQIEEILESVEDKKGNNPKPTN